MDEFEIAYYLDGPELLLLLSLIDRRPVMGLPPIGKPEDWQRVALSLLEQGRLSCRNGRLEMDGGVSRLLLTVKDALRVDMIYGKKPEPVTLTLYGGERPALLEHLPNGVFRLGAAEENAVLHQAEERLFPDYPTPEALSETLEDDKGLQACLARWEKPAVSMEAPAALWERAEEVRGILERWTPAGRTRWIWVEDERAGWLLRQDQTGLRAELDTPSRRRELVRELE